MTRPARSHLEARTSLAAEYPSLRTSIGRWKDMEDMTNCLMKKVPWWMMRFVTRNIPSPEVMTMKKDPCWRVRHVTRNLPI